MKIKSIQSHFGKLVEKYKNQCDENKNVLRTQQSKLNQYKVTSGKWLRNTTINATFFFFSAEPLRPGTGDLSFYDNFPVLETLSFYDIFPVPGYFDLLRFSPVYWEIFSCTRAL